MKEDLRGKQVMHQLRPYRQSHPRGCGPSCLLMILNYFLPEFFPLTRQMEWAIYENAKFSPGETTSMPRLATYALSYGLQVKLWSQDDEPKCPTGMSLEHYNTLISIYSDDMVLAKSLGLELRIGSFSANDLLREELERHRLVIALIRLDNLGEIMHNIVIRGYKQFTVYCIDPLSSNGYIRYPLGRVESMMNLPFTKGALAIGSSEHKFRLG